MAKATPMTATKVWIVVDRFGQRFGVVDASAGMLVPPLLLLGAPVVAPRIAVVVMFELASGRESVASVGAAASTLGMRSTMSATGSTITQVAARRPSVMALGALLQIHKGHSIGSCDVQAEQHGIN
jgi:hypothetical protein